MPEGVKRSSSVTSRPGRSGAALAIVVLLAAAAVASGLVGPRLVEGRSASGLARVSLAQKGIGAFGLGERFSTLRGYRRYGYVVVDRSHARALAGLPGVSLVYMSGADIARFDTGVSRHQAAANGWLLKDASGAYLESQGYEGVQLADVGSRSYQRMWLRNVTAFLKATRIDGVFIDDVMSDIRSWSGRKEFPAKYPSQGAWESAMASFMAVVGPALRAKGYYVLANADGYVHHDTRSDDGSLTVAWWQRLAPSVSGLMTEYWVQNPNDLGQLRAQGSEWYNQWAGWQRLVSVAQRAHVDFFGFTYGTTGDQHPMRYGKGSFLLDWNHRGGAFVFSTTDKGDPYHPAWASDIGRPLEPKTELSPGVWRRAFSRGVVIVNSTAEPVSVVVDGTSRTVGPVDALIAGG